jgi:succinoglycan biosynthesis protein ExoV
VKLYFYDKQPNFGDALNLWLWPQLLAPDTFDEDPATVFVGIGTLLNDRLPIDSLKIVFGSGVGYYGDPPPVDDSWKIYCVRGPLSARALKVDETLAVTDSAVLLRLLDVEREPKEFDFSFMPHWESSQRWDWEGACRSNGMHLIDPLGAPESVLSEIARSRVLVTEAMHGAIVADAMRVPWIPVNIHNRLLEFKWLDWCASVGVPYAPSVVRRPAIREQFALARIEKRLGAAVFGNEAVSRVVHSGASLTFKAAVSLVSPTLTHRCASSLDSIAHACPPQLSADVSIECVTDRLAERLEMFKADVRRGVFPRFSGSGDTMTVRGGAS